MVKLGLPLMPIKLTKEILLAEKDQASLGRKIVVIQTNFMKSENLFEVISNKMITLDQLSSLFEITNRDGKVITIRNSSGGDYDFDLGQPKSQFMMPPRTKEEAKKTIDFLTSETENFADLVSPYFECEEDNKIQNPLGTLIKKIISLVKGGDEGFVEELVMKGLAKA